MSRDRATVVQLGGQREDLSQKKKKCQCKKSFSFPIILTKSPGLSFCESLGQATETRWMEITDRPGVGYTPSLRTCDEMVPVPLER